MFKTLHESLLAHYDYCVTGWLMSETEKDAEDWYMLIDRLEQILFDCLMEYPYGVRFSCYAHGTLPIYYI